MNTSVNFEIAKLLKEKGFNVECCEFYYMENNPNKLEESFNKNKKWDFNFKNEYLKPYKSISAPTIAEVVMWLYEKHGIWISVDPENDTDTWFFTISYNNSETIFGNYSTPTEAYEAAIEYTLNNLI
jgi:hypothetical protein